MPRLLLRAAALLACLATSGAAGAYTKTPVRWEEGGPAYGLAQDCLLSAYDTCSGWIWTFSDVQGAVWGIVLDPTDCPAGCANGGAVNDVFLYSRCSSVPGHLDGIRIEAVDAAYCPSALLYDSGPLTVTHCVTGDRWSHIPVPLVHLNGNPFLLALEWGPTDPGTGHANPKLATDNGVANVYCSMGTLGFPGCATTGSTCLSWIRYWPPELTFMYVTDLNGDTMLEDLCGLYMQPYPLSFPYIYGYGYVPNNLLAVVTVDCTSPTAVEPTSWGRVKALFD